MRQNDAKVESWTAQDVGAAEGVLASGTENIRRIDARRRRFYKVALTSALLCADTLVPPLLLPTDQQFGGILDIQI